MRRHLVGALAGLALGVLVIGVVAFIEDRNRQRLDSVQIETCRRTNVLRAYERLAADLPQVAPRVFALLDCRATVAADGQPVPLPAREQERSLRLVARARLPVVRDGRIVASQPFPQP